MRCLSGMMKVNQHASQALTIIHTLIVGPVVVLQSCNAPIIQAFRIMILSHTQVEDTLHSISLSRTDMIILHRKLCNNVAKNTQRVAVRMRCRWHLQGMVGVFGAMAATMVDLSEAFEQDLNE